MSIIKKYTKTDRRIDIDDWNDLIEHHNLSTEDQPPSNISQYTDWQPADIIVNGLSTDGTSSVLIRSFKWIRNGTAADPYFNTAWDIATGMYDVDKRFTKINFSTSDYSTSTDTSYNGFVYIGAMLSSDTSTGNIDNLTDWQDLTPNNDGRISPNKYHLVKIPVATFENKEELGAQTNTFEKDSLQIIGAVKIDQNSEIVDTYQYLRHNINDYKKEKPFTIKVLKSKDRTIKITDGIWCRNSISVTWTSASYPTADLTISNSDGTYYIWIELDSDMSPTTITPYSATSYTDSSIRKLLGTVIIDGGRISSIDIGYSGYIDDDASIGATDTYTDLDPGADYYGARSTTWDWRTEDSSGNTIGATLYIVTRSIYVTSATNPKLIEYRSKLKINNYGMIEQIGEEEEHVITRPVPLIAP